jgi:hypothetical protein
MTTDEANGQGTGGSWLPSPIGAGEPARRDPASRSGPLHDRDGPLTDSPIARRGTPQAPAERAEHGGRPATVPDRRAAPGEAAAAGPGKQLEVSGPSRAPQHVESAFPPIVTWMCAELQDRLRRNGVVLAEIHLASYERYPERTAEPRRPDREAEP